MDQKKTKKMIKSLIKAAIFLFINDTLKAILYT